MHQQTPNEDDQAAELVKYSPGEVYKRLLALYNRINHKKEVLEDFTNAELVPIYKKSDTARMTNYQGISLLCVA